MNHLRTFAWTGFGKQRVAAAINTTLAFNREKKIKPNSLRRLSKFAGYANHTSIGDYANARTDNPNKDGCKVLRDIAPYIYRVKQFNVEGDGIDRIRKVDHELPPHTSISSDFKYWLEPGLTYADDGWMEFVELGTSSGDDLECRKDNSQTVASYLLLSRVKAAPLDLLPGIAQLLGIPPSTLLGLRGESILNKGEFTSLSQAINDFLIRTNDEKIEEWSMKRLSSALAPEVSRITVNRLQQLMDGAIPTEQECRRLSSVFKSYGVHWEAQELQVLDSQ